MSITQEPTHEIAGSSRKVTTSVVSQTPITPLSFLERSARVWQD